MARSIPSLVFGLAACLLASAAPAAPAVPANPPLQINHAESLRLSAAAGKTRFDALGRHFDITLEGNDRLLKALPSARKSQIGEGRALRGRIDGVPGSWVRLTQVGKGLEGAIWDGSELYVVAPYRSIAGNLSAPMAASADQTVAYRLSDAINGLPAEFCGLARELPAQSKTGTSALLQYKSLVGELRESVIGAVSDQLDISLIADTAFQDANGANSTAEMLARLNVVEGIFTEQVGVLLVPSEFRLVPASANLFTTTDPDALLDELAAFRASTPEVSAAGLAHLMTGRNLDGDIVGIAFVDALCDRQNGVSLSDSELGSFFSALVMAHELGHNFGARHDGVPGVCAGTTQDYLMSPVLNGSTRFSACSLNSMAASIAAARGRCIGSAQYADVALVLPNSPYSVQTDGTFSLPMTVRSLGNLVATNVQLQVTFPPWFQLAGVTLANTTCTTANDVVTCGLGDVAAGEERVLDLRVTGSTLGTYPVKAVLTADNDFVAANNGGEVQVGIQSGIDLGLTVTANPTAAYVTDLVDYTIDVTSHGSLGSHGGNFWINLGGIPVESFEAGTNSCAVDSADHRNLVCQLADVAAGASTRIIVHGRPIEAGIANGLASLTLQNDANSSNNSASFSVAVSAESAVRMGVSQEELRAVVGTPYDLTFTLTATGRLPAENVRFALQQPWLGVFESVTTGSSTCVADPDFVTCDLGTLNPGDVRTVAVRVHFTAIATTSVFASTRWGTGGNQYSTAYTQVYANLDNDVRASTGGFSEIDEGATGWAGFQVENRGVNPAQSATAILELSAPLRLLTLESDGGVPGWTCEILTPQRGRCTGSFPGGSRFDQTTAVIQYSFVSDAATNGLATITVNATDDGDPTNNVAHLNLPIRPFLDVGVTGPNQSLLLMSGDTTAVDATLTTGKNPVPGVTITPWITGTGLEIDSFSVGGFDCSQTLSGGACPLGDLPANSAIPVHLSVHATGGENRVDAILIAQADRDSNMSNNQLNTEVNTLIGSDVQLSLAGTSVTATNGDALDFPLITVNIGTATAREITVDIPLPSFVTVSSVSSSGICTGTTSLQCSFPAVLAGDSVAINVHLHATGTGTFSSNVALHAFNDSTATNNTGAVTVTVNAPSSGGGGGSSSGGGKKSGGGGSFEYLGLAILGSLVWRRGRARLRIAAT